MSIERLHNINSLGLREVSHGEIRIETLEERVIPKVPFPHKHDFYQLILITKGKGWHEIDFNRHTVSKGKFFFMKPAQVHSWNLSKDIEGIVMEFSREGISHDISAFIELMPDCLTLKKEKDYNELLMLSQIMLMEFSSKKAQSEIATTKLLEAFLIVLSRNIDTELNIIEQKSKGKLDKVEELRKLIEDNFKKQHGVDFYSKVMSTNAKNLTMTITRAIGKSPRSLIHERIILEAKRYLAYSVLDISEIGFILGFEDPNYFSRFFKTHAKRTPVEFRNSLGRNKK
jgi:AraC family transcriptional activator of pobA